MKRILFLILSVFGLLLFCSCTQEDTPPGTAVFAGTLLPLDNASITDAPQLTLIEEGGISVHVTLSDGRAAVLCLDADGTTVSTAAVTEDIPADVSDAGMLIDRHQTDGGEVLYAADYDSAEITSRAFVLRDGKTHLTLDPAADLGYSLRYDNPRAGEIFRVTDAIAQPNGDRYRYLLLSDDGLCCYDDDGTLLWSERGNLTRDIVCVDGIVYALRQKAEEQTLHILNTDDGSRSDPIPITGEKTVFTSLGENDMLFTGGGHDLYTANETGIFALDLSDDGFSATCSKMMDFALSDILPDSVLGIAVTDADTAYLALEDMTETYSGPQLWQYKELPPDALPQKTELVLALFPMRSSYQLPIYHFNREHEDVRIVVRDYAVYEDEEERMMRFNTDIMAGDIPDMVILWQNSNYGTSVSTYERSGIFADLKPLLSADPDFDYEGLLSYVTEPYTLEDGGQYIFPLQPGATTYFADPAVASQPMTVDEFLDLHESLGAKPWQGYQLIASAVDDYYSEETAICAFDDGRLEALLSRAEGMAENTGDSPLTYLHLPYPTLWYYVTKMQEALGGVLGDAPSLVPVGLPNNARELCVDWQTCEYFAITTACKDSAAAIEFLQMLMDANKIYNTPLDKLYWNRFSGGLGQTYCAEDVREELSFYEDKTLVYEDNAYFIYADDDPALADAPGWHFKITDAMADAFVSYLDSITRRVNYGSPAASIFREEYRVMADRPIAERLRIIQSKVSIYLSEQMD